MLRNVYLLPTLQSSPMLQSNTHLQVLNQEEGNDLLTETHMTNFQFTIALMVFLIAYALFEVPSNYMLKRLKPSNWIAFLMLSWGAITMGLGGVQNFGAVTAVRFLLGVFEAGLFPGLVCEFWCCEDLMVDLVRWLELTSLGRLLDLLVSF
jgi:MFS family permease